MFAEFSWLRPKSQRFGPNCEKCWPAFGELAWASFWNAYWPSGGDGRRQRRRVGARCAAIAHKSRPGRRYDERARAGIARSYGWGGRRPAGATFRSASARGPPLQPPRRAWRNGRKAGRGRGGVVDAVVETGTHVRYGSAPQIGHTNRERVRPDRAPIDPRSTTIGLGSTPDRRPYLDPDWPKVLLRSAPCGHPVDAWSLGDRTRSVPRRPLTGPRSAPEWCRRAPPGTSDRLKIECGSTFAWLSDRPRINPKHCRINRQDRPRTVMTPDGSRIHMRQIPCLTWIDPRLG